MKKMTAVCLAVFLASQAARAGTYAFMSVRNDNATVSVSNGRSDRNAQELYDLLKVEPETTAVSRKKELRSGSGDLAIVCTQSISAPADTSCLVKLIASPSLRISALHMRVEFEVRGEASRELLRGLNMSDDPSRDCTQPLYSSERAQLRISGCETGEPSVSFNYLGVWP
jgi:hypothetical protein